MDFRKELEKKIEFLLLSSCILSKLCAKIELYKLNAPLIIEGLLEGVKEKTPQSVEKRI